jgi:hypothetical protein
MKIIVDVLRDAPLALLWTGKKTEEFDVTA